MAHSITPPVPPPPAQKRVQETSELNVGVPCSPKIMLVGTCSLAQPSDRRRYHQPPSLVWPQQRGGVVVVQEVLHGVKEPIAVALASQDMRVVPAYFSSVNIWKFVCHHRKEINTPPIFREGLSRWRWRAAATVKARDLTKEV